LSAEAERERIAAILGCEEAKSHEASARHLAFSTALSADDARALLATLPAPSPSLRPLGPRAGQTSLGLVTLDNLAAAKAAASPDTSASADWAEIVENLNRNGPARPN